MKRRNTQAKQEILNVLKESKSALSHEMVQSKIPSNTDRATIYRVLNRFCEDGIVHKIVADDGKKYFALCYDCTKSIHYHDHLHFRCLECGKVECIKGEIRLPLPIGYVSKKFNGIVSGLCKNCS